MPTASITDSRDARPWSSRASVALAALIAGGLLSLIWLAHPYFEVRTDNSRYILLAGSLLAGEGYSYMGDPFTVQMPGFSLLLLPILAVWGTDFQALNLYGCLYGLACVALLFVYWRPRLGMLVSFCLAAAVWLSPGFQWLCHLVMSDVPGATGLVGCLLIERWAGRKPGARRDLLLGLAIAAASYVRLINVLVVPAILLARLLEWRTGEGRWRWRRLPIRRLLLPALIPLVALLPWEMRNERHRLPEPTDELRNYSYDVAVWRSDRGDPGSPRLAVTEVLGRAPGNLGRILESFGNRMVLAVARWLPGESYDSGSIALGTIPFVCLLVALARRRGPGEIFAVSLLAVLLIHPLFAGRHALPVYLLALGTVPEAILALAPGAAGRRLAKGVLAAAILVLAIVDFDPWTRRSQARSIQRAHEQVASLAAATLPADAVLATRIGAGLSVFMRRDVHSFVHAYRREGLEGAERVVEENGVTGVLVLPQRSPELALHLLDRYGGEHCLVASEEWWRRSHHGIRSEPLWLFRLDAPIDDGRGGVAAGSSPLVDGRRCRLEAR